MSDPRELFASGVDLVDAQVQALDAAAWSRPSPCEGWDARDVLVHVTGTLGKVATMLGGGGYAAEPAAVDAKPDPDQAVAQWREAARAARAAVAASDPAQVVTAARGEQPVAQAIALPTADCAVHAWDIAAAAGHPLELPPALPAHVRGVMAHVPPEVRARVFAPPVPAPDGASETDALAAELGRRRP